MHWTKTSKATEIIKRISEAKKKNPTRYWLGKTHSQETREKISQAKLLSDKTVRGEDHHSWVDGTRSGGYRLRKIFGKAFLEHRVSMENKIGRPLKTNEVVHHVDGNRKNNEANNLMLFRSSSAHLRLHTFAKRHGLDMEDLVFPQPWLMVNT